MWTNAPFARERTKSTPAIPVARVRCERGAERDRRATDSSVSIEILNFADRRFHAIVYACANASESRVLNERRKRREAERGTRYGPKNGERSSDRSRDRYAVTKFQVHRVSVSASLQGSCPRTKNRRREEKPRDRLPRRSTTCNDAREERFLSQVFNAQEWKEIRFCHTSCLQRELSDTSFKMHTSTRYAGYHVNASRDYVTDGEESHRAPSDRTVSEYIVANEHTTMVKPIRKNDKYDREERRSRSAHNTRDSVLSGSPKHSLHPLRKSASHGSICDNGSDIYVTSAAYRATSDISRISRHSLAPSSRLDHRAPSHYSYGSGRSGTSTVKTRTSRKGGIIVETMSTPNPFCPNTKGVCCLMLLLNLGLLLVTLGFVIVIQFFQPLVVWILGIVFLIFGFLTLIGSLVYCVHVFRNAKHPQDINPEDLYWTHYWQGRVGSPAPEVYYKAEDKYQDDGYSDRYSKYSGKYYDRQSQRY